MLRMGKFLPICIQFILTWWSKSKTKEKLKNQLDFPRKRNRQNVGGRESIGERRQQVCETRLLTFHGMRSNLLFEVGRPYLLLTKPSNLFLSHAQWGQSNFEVVIRLFYFSTISRFLNNWILNQTQNVNPFKSLIKIGFGRISNK
jgi:hypothetical protein